MALGGCFRTSGDIGEDKRETFLRVLHYDLFVCRLLFSRRGVALPNPTDVLQRTKAHWVLPPGVPKASLTVSLSARSKLLLKVSRPTRRLHPMEVDFMDVRTLTNVQKQKHTLR